MDRNTIRNELDYLIEKTENYNDSKIPGDLLTYLSQWKWGSYGWVSPASLMFTAAWRKYYYPDVDCCKIWADDENKKPIPGGYSIRTEDERVSIPILAKHDLCAGFCSPNSGMQGSRAIEKMRSLKRLNRDFDSSQQTIFDLKLFASIMNDINKLNQTQLIELLKWFICKAKSIKASRDKTNNLLTSVTATSFDLLAALGDIHDPELTKCVVAACFQALFEGDGMSVSGVGDNKTAADARTGKPGDLTVEAEGIPVVAIEVKDKTQKIDWNNIERATRIIKAHKELRSFVFVLESRDAATNGLVNEMVQSEQLSSVNGRPISIMSLYALYNLAHGTASDEELIRLTSNNISLAPSVKPETKRIWTEKVVGNKKGNIEVNERKTHTERYRHGATTEDKAAELDKSMYGGKDRD